MNCVSVTICTFECIYVRSALRLHTYIRALPDTRWSRFCPCTTLGLRESRYQYEIDRIFFPIFTSLLCALLNALIKERRKK